MTVCIGGPLAGTDQDWETDGFTNISRDVNTGKYRLINFITVDTDDRSKNLRLWVWHKLTPFQALKELIGCYTKEQLGIVRG